MHLLFPFQSAAARQRRISIHSIGMGQDTHVLIAALLPTEDQFQVNIANGQVLDIAQQQERTTKKVLVTLAYDGAMKVNNLTSLCVERALCAYLVPVAQQHPLLLVQQGVCADLQLQISYQIMDPWALSVNAQGGER